ncbi:MAG TPA: helix-turn-helix transcriptional regulator [Thermoanaerobaculia bacterium]
MRQRKARQEARRKKFGKALVKARRRRKWSQSELARRLEMSRDRLSKWERGVHIPSLEDVTLLSEVLRIPFWELGLGDAPAEGISSVELLELARSFSTISRVLKPWLSRLSPELAGNAK